MQLNLSWLSNLRVFQKGLLLVGAPLVITLVLVGVLFQEVQTAERDRLNEFRNKKIAENVARVEGLFYDAGHMLHEAFSKMDPDAFKAFKTDLISFARTKRELIELADQTPETRAKYHDLFQNNSPMKTYLPLLTDMAHHRLSPIKLLPMLPKIKSDIKTSSIQMTESYRKIRADNDFNSEENTRRRHSRRLIEYANLFGGMFIMVVAAFLLARFFMTNIVQRLKVMTDNAERLAGEQALNPQLQGKDEIADLDGVFHEMSEALARAARKERAAFDNASDVICVLDSDGKITRINAACARFWGHSPIELIGAMMTDLVSKDDVETTTQSIRSVQTGTPSAEFENRIKHRDGHEICILWSVYWSDVESALFCVAHDITERKQAEQMKQDFLGMVSHDLRSPLTSIYGVFQLLSAKAFGELPEMAAAKLGMAAKNVNRLLTLVNDLLDIEKLEAGQMELQREVLPPGELLKRSVSDIEALAEQRKINVEVDCTVGAFSLDLDRMMQVLVNLLSNAIKFSPEGGSVTLAAHSSADGLVITVKDQGRGVPASHREAIFERFKQVEAADGKRKSGTGLGLPICKQIVELHGGTIGVDSEEGHGSTFWIKIPLQSHEVETTRLKTMPDTRAKRKTKPKSPTVSPQSGKAPASSIFSRLSLPQKGFILVGVPAVLGLIFVMTWTTVLWQADISTAKQSHYAAIASTASELVTLMWQVGTAMANEKTPESWRYFDSSASAIPLVRNRLKDLTKDEPHLHELVAQLEAVLAVPFEYMGKAQKLVRSQGATHEVISEAWEGHEQLESDVARMSKIVDQLVSQAQSMEDDSPEILERNRHWQEAILNLALVFSIITSIILAIFFSRGVTGRLYVLRDNTQRLTDDRPLNPELSGNDEIAQLDKVFHSMARTLREARQKERAVFDNSQDVICAVDEHGVFQRMNPASERIWGYSPDSLLKRSITDIVMKDDIEATGKAIATRVNGSELQSFENRVVGNDGSVRDMLWSASWSPSEDLYFCTAHDISKRKELERLKQEFLAMVSHDLRTPLTAIMGVAKLGAVGAFGQLPEKATQQLNVVTRNVDRLLGLINDLLDIEKLEAGQMQLTIENIPAYSVLERSLQALDTFAEQKHVKLVSEPTDAYISADADRLIQVLVNLMSNAIKFSPEGGTVTLSAADCPDFVEIRVRDEGRGVPESFKETIFERYKQVEASDGKRKSGTGLGLPICKQIVLSHGGTIGVNSEVGKGSTFWFRIPKVPTADVPPASKS